MQQPRFYFRVTITIAALLTIGVTLANGIGRLFDDPKALEIRSFFNPVGCPRPCLMGIRPGVTTLSEAIQLLKDSPWVKEINDSGLKGGEWTPYITWEWTPQAPDFIRNHSTNIALVTNGRVVQIDLRSELTLGKVQHALGPPGQMEMLGLGKEVVEYDVYDKSTLRFETNYSCPLTQTGRFNAFVTIRTQLNSLLSSGKLLVSHLPVNPV